MRIAYHITLVSFLVINLLAFNTCSEKKEIIKGSKYGRDFEFELVDGKISYAKEYDSLGNLYAKHIVDGKNHIFKDSSIYYRPDDKTVFAKRYYTKTGKLFYQKEYSSEGDLSGEGNLTDDELFIGLWNYYYKNGNLKEHADYIALKDSTFLNNVYAFEQNGKDTIYEYSKFYKLEFPKDTIEFGEAATARATLKAPYFRGKNSKIVVLLPKFDESRNFTANFDNIDDIVVDSIQNMNTNEEYRKHLNIKSRKQSWNRLALFGKRFKKKGPQKFRGILVEYVVTDTASNGTVSGKQNYTYFEKDIYVKDSVQ